MRKKSLKKAISLLLAVCLWTISCVALGANEDPESPIGPIYSGNTTTEGGGENESNPDPNKNEPGGNGGSGDDSSSGGNWEDTLSSGMFEIPISESAGYSYKCTGSHGLSNTYVACQINPTKPEVYKQTSMKCVAYVNGGIAIPPFIQKSTVYSKSGKQTVNMSFLTKKWVDDWTTYGACKITLTMNVYQGSSQLAESGNYYDSDIIDSDLKTDPTPEGIDPWKWNEGEGDPPIQKGETIKTNGGGSGGGTGGGTGDSYNDYADALNDILNDNNSFNANDDDFSSSFGGDLETDLEDYLNGVSGEADLEGLTEDLLGLDSFEAAMVNPINESDIIGYDENGRPIIGYDENGNPIYGYDENGNAIIGYDADGRPIIGYDENGNPIYGYDADGNAIIGYDSDGRPIVGYDSNGNPIYGYDADGNPIIGYDSNGNPIIGYDSNGNPIYASGYGGGLGFNGVNDADALNMFMDMLNGNGSGADKLLGGGGGSSGILGGLSDALANALGQSEEVIRRNTADDQEMFNMAYSLLKSLGLKDEDILNGRNYTGNSAYTEPNEAWDFNRTTKLLKNKNLKLPSSLKDEKTKEQKRQNKPLFSAPPGQNGQQSASGTQGKNESQGKQGSEPKK